MRAARSAGPRDSSSRATARAPTAGGRAVRAAPGVDAEHHVGIEHLEQRVEVAGPRGGEEGGDDLALAAEVGIGRGRRAAHAPARAAGELARGGGRAVDDRGDLVERHAEHVVQHEGEALGGGERVEDDEQREPDRVGQLGLVGRVGVLAGR